MARRKLQSGSGTGGSAFETGGFRPAPGTLVLMFVTSARPLIPGGAAGIPSVTGNGLAWVSAQSVLYGTNGDRRLSCFRASGPAPVDGAAVIDFGDDGQDYCAWSIVEYSDVDLSGASGAAAVAQIFPVTGTGQSLTAALAPSADPNRNVAVGALAVESAAGAALAIAPGAGFTEIDELVVTQFLAKAGALQTQDATAANTAVSWTWNTSQSAAALVVEVKSAPPAGGGGPGTGTGGAGAPTPNDRLVKRFEPVLFFHPEEKFYPSDAKRFVERAALWTARSPGDDRNGWGGQPGGSFPRRPTVPAGQLAAVNGEPGDFRFGEQLGAGNDFRFLELGGWKDRDEVPESGVTTQSSNPYSNRDAIKTLYDGELEASRFWYHAEVFDEQQLRAVGRAAPGIDLSRVLGRFTDPTLLCYYFFFPAHDQTVDSTNCNGIEAKEVSSHAGDWQCLAILGEGTGDAFIPKFLGRTGSRPVDGVVYPPYQFDDDQATAMIVGAWTGTEPALTGGHPRLFVALGSHSLYTRGGVQGVDPYPSNMTPQWCGTLDAPAPAAPDDSDDYVAEAFKDIAILLAKMGTGWSFGPIGAAVGLVSCIVEIANYRAPFEPFGVAPNLESPADPDQPPPGPGAGKTVKPAGLSVPDAGSDVVDWRSARGLQIDGRVYDCIVNRATQPWWPGADTRSGFNGRWGQHVTADGLSRRAGPRFPNYPQMFLLALADGEGRGLLTLDG